MDAIILLVAGAPGAGKTTALAALLGRAGPYLAFDIDWLAAAASRLARADIRLAPETWPAYNALWFEFLGAIARNGRRAIFFAPLDRRDVAGLGLPAGRRVAWLLLDCADDLRRARLARRADWTPALIAEALADARELRAQIPEQIDTGAAPPDAVAAAILAWAGRVQPPA